ncbi:hypothetical protein [Nocardia sp. NRRL S-836]|uniref:hypothetical protein n=1 Tax=Nocardia sp. NRRL S-836 TaxID=1519492 RepID=UPI0006AEB14B|nr:hypothetical protein [Nocardia sp. NRRL S-836]KOV77638.1 hypothetical protein ADL03_41580 [Nocardia sp. NRRL S-836]
MSRAKFSALREAQLASVLVRFAYRGLSLSAALAELAELTSRPDRVADAELGLLLARIDSEHRAGRLKTHPTGPWAGAPTGVAIAQQLGIGKAKLRAVRDAYYVLYRGLPPFDADEPLHSTVACPCT